MATPITSSNPELLHPGWSSLSGKVLEGGFELQEIVEADESQARFRVRVLGDRDLDCVAVFFPLSAQEAQAQVEIWTLTRQLRHPNVSAPLGTGQLTIDGLTAAYVVLRRADESLDAVLSERALTVDEAGEALGSIAKALEALHLNGLAHGCLAPSRVLAVGESIKLPAECVRSVGLKPAVRVFAPAYLAPESQGENVTQQADLWCLGATLFEALTQKVWTEASREETGALPEPFGSIALRCLHTDADGRANLGEVMALFRGELKPVPRVRAALAGSSTVLIVPERDLAEPRAAKTETPKPPANPELEEEKQAKPRQAAPVAPALPKPQPSAAAPQAAAAASTGNPPVLVSVPNGATGSAASKGVDSTARPSANPRSSFDESIQNENRRRTSGADQAESVSRIWIWAGITFLVVLGLLWAIRPKSGSEKTVTSPTVAPTTTGPTSTGSKPNAASSAANAKPPASMWETRTLQPDGTARATPAAPARTSESKTMAKSGKAPAVAATAAVGEKHLTATPAAGQELWRVVVYTYAREGDAQEKAEDINTRHGNLQAEVFSPSGSGSPFLVTVGGRMTRDDAAQLRRKAVGSGLPHDSYIQNYKR